MKPTEIDALRNQASAAHRAGKIAEARAFYARYLALCPGDGGIWSNVGALLRSQQQHTLALRAQERAYALMPDAPGLRNNLANILSDLGHYDRSIALREEILQRAPQDKSQRAMIGRCLRGLGRYSDAIDYLKAAEADHPDDSEIKLQRAFAELGEGRYGEAFRTYDARWQSEEMTPRQIDLPQWDGGDLAGKTVLVLPEQGFGDAVLFARFLPALRQHCARVLFLAERPLVRLFDGLDAADWVGTELPATEKVDCWINLMDMPLLVFGADNSGVIPAPTCLNIPADSATRAKAIVGPHKGKFKIGVVWSGSATYKGNSFRSFSHRQFHPLIDVPDVQMFSLYKGPFLETFVADGTSMLIQDTASTDRDFADCAATMQEMDLIITSDTATAHIAGSLGLPTWVLLHWDPFWVFRHSGDTTDWYPEMQLYRQPNPLDWDSVFAKVETDLRKRVTKWKKEQKRG